MSFLPGRLAPALLCSCRRKVISHSDGHSILRMYYRCGSIWTNKKSRLHRASEIGGSVTLASKMMFYVIGSEDQSRGLLRTAPANRTKGVVEQFGTSGVPIPCRMNRLIMSQHGRTLYSVVMYVWVYFPRHYYTRCDGFLSTL